MRAGSIATFLGATFVVATVPVAGCSVTSVDDLLIPCDSDDNCPTGAWCDLPLNECRTGGNNAGPPDIAIDGFGLVLGTYASTVTVPAHEETSLYVRIRNVGHSQVAYPEVAITGPICLNISGGLLGGNLAGILDPGDAYEDRFSVSDDCAAPTDATIDIRVDRRDFEGHVTVSTGP